jgi:hypothetical protein
MGCDIHLYVEKRDGDRWVSADKWSPNEYHAKYPEDGEPEYEIKYEDRFYRDRNYDLFAMLANVRNGVGFAGCDTGDGFKPIALPKGLPADVSPEIRAESDRWNGDGHSHSYLTLAELEAYDWQGSRTNQRGWVSAEEFKNFRLNGKPNSWSGGVSGYGVRHISNEEMEGRLKYDGDTRSCYTQVEWGETYAEAAGRFLTETMPKLRDLACGDPESVRIVFFFDN